MTEIVVKLVLFGGLMVGGLLWLRHASRAGTIGRPGPALRVTGRAGLTRTSLVAVVDVDGRRFLVGAGDQGVNLLTELDVSTASRTPTAQTPSYDHEGHDEVFGPHEHELLVPTAITSDAHGTGDATSGPRIGPLDRLREMTVRSHLREPIRARTNPKR